MFVVYFYLVIFNFVDLLYFIKLKFMFYVSIKVVLNNIE